ncbi:MAG: FlgD immunoglobulin-like domain containing protein, partial [Candidatus Poribacteria bacterium]
NHLFVLNARNGLRAYDVSDPADPKLVQSLFSGRAYLLRAADDRLYVSDGGNGFRVFSIAAMPAMPLQGVLEVIIRGAAPRQGIVWGGSAELVGVDTRVPNAFEIIQTLDTTAQPRDTALRGDTLVVAEAEAGMRLVDLSGPPRTVARVSTRGAAHGVALDGEWAYIADGPAGVAVMNVRDRFAPVYASHVDTRGLATKAHGAGGRVYVANGGGGLVVADRSQLLSHAPTRGRAHDVAVRGSLAYVATAAGLEVVDLSDLAAPVVGDPVPTPNPASGVALSGDGDVAYVAAGDVLVFDVTGPRPQAQRTLSVTGFASSVYVGGDLLAVAATEDGIELYDIATPAAPRLLARVRDARNARAIVRHNDTLFVGAGEDLVAYDVTDPSQPAELNRWDAQFDVRVLAARDGRIFAGGETTVAGWDARNPEAPSLLFRDRTFRWVGGVALEGARLYVADMDRLHIFRREDDGALYVRDPVTPQPTLSADLDTYVTGVGQSYPNPFNPETWIPFELASASRVEVSIYDPAGRLVRTIRMAMLDEGRYATRGRALHWDGRNARGGVAPAGLYFYRFTATPAGAGATFRTIRRMTLTP